MIQTLSRGQVTVFNRKIEIPNPSKAVVRVGKLLPILLLLYGPAAAQTVVFNVEKPKEVRLAEKFELRYKLEYQGDFEISLSTSKLSGDEFHLLRLKKNEKNTFSLELIPFTIGISTFPSLEFSFVSGGASYTVRSPEIPLDIKPFFDKKEEAKLIDIYPPFVFVNWVKILLIAAALALAVWLLYKKLMKSKPGISGISTIVPDNRTPYQKAMDELSSLIGSGLPDKEKVKDFYIGLSDILRKYLEGEFLIQANKMTTNDLAKNLKDTFRDIKDLISLREFLDGCDLVKFAKHSPEMAEMSADIEKLKAIINLLEDISSKKKAAAAAAAMTEKSAAIAPAGSKR